MYSSVRSSVMDQMMFDLNRPDEPVLIRRGPVSFSTGQTLTASPVLCWDVNRYYRDLGVDWPYLDASRGDLRKAYLLLEGQFDARMTFCLKALLDKDTKARYDRAELGRTFFDPYVIAEIKRRAMAELRSRGYGQEDVSAVIEEFNKYGMELGDDDSNEDKVDNSKPEGHDDLTPAGDLPPFPYSFYLWRSTCQNVERLEQWQYLLITEFRSRGLSRSISLGYVGHHPHHWLTGTVGYQDVVFLNEYREPNPEDAAAVADRMLELEHGSTARTKITKSLIDHGDAR